jgi:hypothetical protein
LATEDDFRHVELWERRIELALATVARAAFIALALLDPDPAKLVPLGLSSLPYRRIRLILEYIRAWRALPPSATDPWDIAMRELPNRDPDEK